MKGHLLEPDGTAMTVSMGKLNDEQEAIVRIFVAGRNVHDLGSGQLALAKKLVELGAHTVTAVDKDYSDYRFSDRAMWMPPSPQISLVGEYFEEYAKHGHHIDVAFLSWPECYKQQSIVQLIQDARVVIYLGSNFSGTACGVQPMWKHLKQREVLAFMPDRWNSLIVYSSKIEAGRRLLPEEYAALHREDVGYFAYGEDIEALL